MKPRTTRKLGIFTALVSAVVVLLGVAQAKERTDDDLPKDFQKAPYSVMSLSVGSPANGWQLRAKKLRPGDHLYIKPSSRDAVYGHPALVLMLHRTANQMAREAGGATLVVGDLSSKYGGPLPGHHSHQSGRDADVGFFVTDQKGRSQRLDHFVKFDAKGEATDGSGLRFDDYRNWLMVQMWLRDQRAEVRYVFVATHLRRRLLDFAQARPAFRKYAKQAAALLLQPRNSSAHSDHFHVRIAYPKRHEGLCLEHGHVND
jgi:penicillin-insensitive murein endopeptidase